MARTFDVSDRVVLLLTMIGYLRESGPTTVTELAQRFDADEQLIRKLVVFLGTAGIPGETHTYQPEDLFDIDWDALEEADTVSLTHLVAVDDTPRFSSAEYAALLAGLHVLGDMLPGEQQQLAIHTAAKLAQAAPGEHATSHSKPSPITVSAQPSDPQLMVVARAIEARRRVAFTYQDLRGVSTVRRIEPFGLTQSGSEWYVRGYCLDRGADRTFLLAGMRDTRDTGEAAERRTQDAVSVIGPSEASIPAVIRVRTSALHMIAGFDPVVTGEVAPGWVRAEVLLEHPSAAIRLLQLAGGEVTVEAPTEARDAVSDWVSRALAPYDQ